MNQIEKKVLLLLNIYRLARIKSAFTHTHTQKMSRGKMKKKFN
jgi:hypothetical protein